MRVGNGWVLGRAGWSLRWDLEGCGNGEDDLYHEYKGC